MNKSQEIIQITEKYGARNYKPLPVVIAKGKGVWVESPEGTRYMDMLSCYSALNHGHGHPRIIKALKDQADKVTLTSRAFYNELLGPFCQKVAQVTQKEMVLTMNTGTEAVETAIKLARRWAYYHKGIPDGQAEIITCEGNFHGRTVTVVSFSTTEEYRNGFGAFTPGFKIIPYGDAEALKAAITPNTAAFLVEPIQGEGGIIIPPKGFLKSAYEICQQNNVLFMADEIQTGLGRTGKMFSCDWEGVIPDVYILGKALGGGVIPISAVVANKEILGVFEPGSHGSTFGGNPLACACAIAALEVIEEEKLAEKSLQMGEYFINQLKKIKSTNLKEVRGRGLLIGVEFYSQARPYCEKLMLEGVLCKETHDYVVRFAPPLIITREEIDWAMERINKVFTT